MLGKRYDSQVCSIARALEVVGERWSLLIVRDALFAGTTRYTDFQRRLGIATNVLRDRLDGFVEAGVMRRERGAEQSPHHEYVLTEKGRDLAPALIALTAWGDRWAAPEGPPIILTHGRCGETVAASVTCDRCGEIDHVADDLLPRPGPGMPAAHLATLDEVTARGGRRPG